MLDISVITPQLGTILLLPFTIDLQKCQVVALTREYVLDLRQYSLRLKDAYLYKVYKVVNSERGGAVASGTLAHGSPVTGKEKPKQSFF